jgi:hypothetical protein
MTMSHNEAQAGADARILEPERVQMQQGASPAGQPDADQAALQRQLLIYGTAGKPAHAAQAS